MPATAKDYVAQFDRMFRNPIQAANKIQCIRDGMRVRVFWVSPDDLEIVEITTRVGIFCNINTREKNGRFWLVYKGSGYCPVQQTAEEIARAMKLDTPYIKYYTI